MNTKHADILAQLNIAKRKRGRPRKYLVEPPENNYEKSKFENYFTEPKRKKESNDKGTETEINFNEFVQKIYNDLYGKYKGCFYKDLATWNEEPILNYLVNKKALNLNICDDIMCKYLDYVIPLANENYLEFITKFLVLFRECVNLGQKNVKPDQEFTSVETAEILPEQCNDFFSVFLENNNFFGFSDDDKTELIEIIQHFCFWLFLNNYTKSKLSLAG